MSGDGVPIRLPGDVVGDVMGDVAGDVAAGEIDVAIDAPGAAAPTWIVEPRGIAGAATLSAVGLAERIYAIDDPTMRAGRLAMLLFEVDVDVVALAIETAARQVQTPLWRVLYLAFAQVVLIVRQRPNLPAGPLRADHERVWPSALSMARWVGSANRGGHAFCVGLLRGALQAPDGHDHRLLPPPVAIEHLPLGVRRERARGPNRAHLAQLLVDTDPSVVELLARNPRLRQADVMRLATNRRTHPWALWAILLAPRWLADRAIPEAIAHNPSCPPWLLLALAPLLESQALGDALRKRPLLGAEILAPMAVLHRGALAPWVAERLQQLSAVDVDAVVVVDDEASLGGGLSQALADALAEAVAGVSGDESGEIGDDVSDDGFDDVSDDALDDVSDDGFDDVSDET